MKKLDNHHALLIGVGFKDNEHYMRRDAQALYDILVDEDLAGYKPENVKLLIGEDASRKKVRAAFDDLARRTNADSKVLIYYSGHGSSFRDKYKNEVVSEIKKDEEKEISISEIEDIKEKRRKERGLDKKRKLVGVNTYFLELWGYQWNDDPGKRNTEPKLMEFEIREHLNRIKADRLTFFFDCCHAQGMTDEGILTTAEKLNVDHGTTGYWKEVRDDTLKGEQAVHMVDQEEGFAIISACKDHQKSWRDKNEPNGVFTTCLIEALKGENIIDPKDPYVRLADVVTYLSEEVPKRAKQIPYEVEIEQDPFFNLSFDANFELCKVPKSKIRENLLEEFERMQIQPSKSRPQKEIKTCFRKSKDADNALIFAHGFTGKGHETFGKIPYILMGDEKMDNWNLFPFGINQNVAPGMGNGVWAYLADLNRYADFLRSRIMNEFSKYDQIGIVAYSLGGLAVQQAILALDAEVLKKLSHVILIATPSNGITNDAIKKHWKTELSDFMEGSPFIRKLRSDWDKTFESDYPFEFKVVAATRDKYVSMESCHKPFDRRYRELVDGDHITAVHKETNENDTYELILSTLTGRKFNRTHQGEYDRIIGESLNRHQELEEDDLIKLVHALDGSGKQEKAIEILKVNKLAQQDSDMLRILGDLYRTRYLNNSSKEDGESALDCYTRAYDIARKDKDKEDVYLSAVDLAFLNLMLENDRKDMIKYAEEALKLAEKSLDSLNRSKTMAEANLYLENMAEARSYYAKAAKEAGTNDKISIYTDALTAYSALTNTDDPNDEFILFLKQNYQ